MRKTRKDKGEGRDVYKRGPGLTKDNIERLKENNIGETLVNERVIEWLGIIQIFIYKFTTDGIIQTKGVSFEGLEEFVSLPEKLLTGQQEYAMLYNNLEKLKYDINNKLQNPEPKVYRAVIGKKRDSGNPEDDSQKEGPKKSEG